MTSFAPYEVRQKGAAAVPQPLTISISHDLPAVCVLRTEVTAHHELIIEVESTLTNITCRRCGQTISAFYGYDRPIRLRHLSSFGYVVYIQFRPKRFRCPFWEIIRRRPNG